MGDQDFHVGEFDVVGWAADNLSDRELAGIVGARMQQRGGQRGGYGHGPQQRGGQQRQLPPGGYGGRGPMQPMGPQAGFPHPSFPGMPQGPLGMAMPPGTPMPGWFQSALGVSPPMELLNELPLTPNLNGGVFTSAVTAIQFTARPQRPFRSERPVASVARTGTSAANLLVLNQPFFVGVIPQAVEIGQGDIETYTKDAFGVRLAMTDAAQGTLISVTCTLSGALAGTDSIIVTIKLLGRALA